MTNILFAAIGLLAIFLAACAPQKSQENLLTVDGNSDSIIRGPRVSALDAVASSTVAIVNRSGQSPFCTGTLIDKDLVITAAHCVVNQEGALNQEMQIKFGTSSIGGERRNVTRLILNQQYLERNSEEKDTGDLALLQFEGELPESAKPAALLEDSAVLKNGATAIIAGFGITNGLSQKTTSSLLKASVVIDNANFSSTELTFSQANGSGACHGDSGGPAYIKVGDQLRVFGVTSRAASTTLMGLLCLKGSIYTSIPKSLAWINEAILALHTQESE